jgi:hypothetical protein
MNEMEMPPGSVSPSQEQLEEAEYLEASKKTGEQYVSLVGEFIGKQSEQEVLESGSKLEQIRQRARENFERQHLLAQSGDYDAKKILEQVPQFKTEPLLADTSQYRMEELSSGVFALHIKPELYEKLRPGAQGLAVKIKEGISFIMLPEYPDSEMEQSQLAENVPHETHHLVWYFSEGDIITNDETEPSFEHAFTMYQDEVMARLCSDGGLTGYTHLTMLDPATRAQFVKENPETAEQLIKTTVELNDLLQEIDDIRKQTDIKKPDLITAVMEARTFEQMSANLLKAKNIIENQPITNSLPKSVPSGFDSPI